MFYKVEAEIDNGVRIYHQTLIVKSKDKTDAIKTVENKYINQYDTLCTIISIKEFEFCYDTVLSLA